MRSHLYYIMLLAFIISLVTGPPVIYYLRRFKLGQHVRDDGPRMHLKKKGTPTMGGVIFLFSLLVISLFFAPRTLKYFLLIMVTIGNGAIGLADDVIKFVHKRPLGLKARNKLLGQVILVIILSFFLGRLGHSTVINFPLTDFTINLGLFYPLFMMLIIIGASNAVNLTDGLDGLASGTVIISLLAYLFIASGRGHSDTAFFCAALTGACFGFLIYNIHPAKIFMGDAGSLSLGAALGTVAVLTKTEILLALIGGVVVVETLSVIIQVVVFQSTGKRVFKMAPLHHHFELSGWSEWKVVIVFWGAAFILAVIGLMISGA